MGIRGVEAWETGGHHAVLITHLSAEFAALIVEGFARICFGDKATEEPEIYDFAEARDEFIASYRKKKRNSQIGMIGELLCHVLSPHLPAPLSSASLFLNKEERAVKKGFDLVFTDRDATLWYGEVKSSESSVNSAQSAIHNLLSTAAKDLKDKLDDSDRRTPWRSAIMDADALIASNTAVQAKDLLLHDFRVQKQGGTIDSNALLMAVLFREDALPDVDVTSMAVHIATSSVISGQFGRVAGLAIRKATVDAIVDCLESA